MLGAFNHYQKQAADTASGLAQRNRRIARAGRKDCVALTPRSFGLRGNDNAGMRAKAEVDFIALEAREEERAQEKRRAAAAAAARALEAHKRDLKGRVELARQRAGICKHTLSART